MLWDDKSITVYKIKEKNEEVKKESKTRNLYSLIKDTFFTKEQLPKFKMIVCMTKDGLIGDAKPKEGTNGLLWHSKEELKFFKDTTKGNVIVVGYNTAKFMPLDKIKQDRDVIIHNPNLMIIDIQNKYKNTGKDIFICGGAQTYKHYLETYDYIAGCHFDEIYVSVLKDHMMKFEKPEHPLYFPDIMRMGYICVKRTEYGDFINYVFKHTSEVVVF